MDVLQIEKRKKSVSVSVHICKAVEWNAESEIFVNKKTCCMWCNSNKFTVFFHVSFSFVWCTWESVKHEVGQQVFQLNWIHFGFNLWRLIVFNRFPQTIIKVPTYELEIWPSSWFLWRILMFKYLFITHYKHVRVFFSFLWSQFTSLLIGFWSTLQWKFNWCQDKTINVSLIRISGIFKGNVIIKWEGQEQSLIEELSTAIETKCNFCHAFFW